MTLSRDKSDEWSNFHDFGLKENLGKKYLNNEELDYEMGEFESNYPDIAEVFMNEADWSRTIHALLLTDKHDDEDDRKINIGLFGGLYGSQPVGRELLLRFGRHLAKGFTVNDPEITQLFKQANIYILPAVDSDGMDKFTVGTCSSEYDLVDEQGSQFNKKKKFNVDNKNPIEAVKTFLRNYRIDVGLSVESNGLFMRLPWDDDRKSDPPMEDSLRFLATSYYKSNNDLINETCSNNVANGLIKGSSLSKYSGSILDFMSSNYNSLFISAHISCCNYPYPRELPSLYKNNLPSLKSFLRSATQGIYGHVTDIKGRPLKDAIISLLSTNVGNSEIIPVINGSFTLILPVGVYKLNVTLEGYDDKIVEIKIEQVGKLSKKKYYFRFLVYGFKISERG